MTEAASKACLAERRFEEGVDYYFDDGLMVLTADFLLRRGICCGNGCRHCPYQRDRAKCGPQHNS